MKKSLAAFVLGSIIAALIAIFSAIAPRETQSAYTNTANGVYNTSPLSLTNGQSAPMQLDNTGVMKIDCWTNCGLAQASTTSGQIGSLVLGAATTAAPTDTTGLSYPLSLDTAGNLRVLASEAGSPWANNITQFGGSAVVTGLGTSGAGIPRVTISNDSVLAANQSVNIAQMGGTAIVPDPCQAITHTPKTISITANTQIITGAAGKQTSICSLNIGPITTATSVALVEGTGTTCATGTLGMAGGITAATGWVFAANGGIAFGDGVGTIYQTTTAGGGSNVCLFVSAANQVSGALTWVQK